MTHKRCQFVNQKENEKKKVSHPKAHPKRRPKHRRRRLHRHCLMMFGRWRVKRKVRFCFASSFTAILIARRQKNAHDLLINSFWMTFNNPPLGVKSYKSSQCWCTKYIEFVYRTTIPKPSLYVYDNVGICFDSHFRSWFSSAHHIWWVLMSNLQNYCV